MSIPQEGRGGGGDIALPCVMAMLFPVAHEVTGLGKDSAVHPNMTLLPTRANTLSLSRTTVGGSERKWGKKCNFRTMTYMSLPV